MLFLVLCMLHLQIMHLIFCCICVAKVHQLKIMNNFFIIIVTIKASYLPSCVSVHGFTPLNYFSLQKELGPFEQRLKRWNLLWMSETTHSLATSHVATLAPIMAKFQTFLNSGGELNWMLPSNLQQYTCFLWCVTRDF